MLTSAREAERVALLAIARIDELVSEELDSILHHPRFQALEASWRGLRTLVDEAPADANVRVRVLSISWRELARDLERAIEFDHSQIFQKVYSAEFGMPGGEPFGVLLGDYAVAHKPREGVDDVGVLRAMSQVAAAAFAPFFVGAHPSLFGLDTFAELERPLDLARSFQTPELTKWNSLRATEDARFLGVVLPRVLARLPWGDDPERADPFRYREDASAPDASAYLWGNAVYQVGEVLLRAFAESGWFSRVRGAWSEDSGGLVKGLPQAWFDTDAPQIAPRGAVEVEITPRREMELDALGFVPLCTCPSTPWASFHSLSSLQQVKRYDDPEAAVNARLSSMLSYLLCVSRFAHYIKVMARDRTGAYVTSEEIEREINAWLQTYTISSEDVSDEMVARYPLAEGRARVREVPGRPGAFRSEIHLRPHLQFEAVSATIRLVTDLAAASPA